jgi:2-desacetyl-2-hydroxyethyl bacteriochlorophyllide A dehydrogenase
MTTMADETSRVAEAFWIAGAGQGTFRKEQLRRLGDADVLVETLASGVSRGTERLVFQGAVPESQHQRMRAPFQEGDFTFPVKYGYASVGRVTDGDAALIGKRVFCLHPHQTCYVVPAEAVIALPDVVPSERAVLAANMETALNALWDAPPRIGDRIAVIGCGVVGALVASLARDVPGVRLELIDINPKKAAIADALDLTFVSPDEASPDCDLVIHASGHPEGLVTALSLAGIEATVLEMSWYGDRPVTLPLGEDFHSRRLQLISSQVGMVAPAMRARRSYRDRLSQALELLADDRFDALLSPPRSFHELPAVMSALSSGPDDVMCQLITYR